MDKDGGAVTVSDTTIASSPKTNTFILNTSFPQTFSLKCEDFGDGPWGQQIILSKSDDCVGSGTETSSAPKKNPRFEEF